LVGTYGGLHPLELSRDNDGNQLHIATRQIGDFRYHNIISLVL
jgi:hypothetical protein